jgi:hypothetical protein
MENNTNTGSERRREAQLRRLARSMGLALRKSRARDTGRMDFGCYKIVSINGDYVVAGGFPYGFSLSLDAVEAVLDELLAGHEDEAIRREWAVAHGAGGQFDAKWGSGGR